MNSKRNTSGMPPSRGFTVIELMVTLTILGVLLSIGIPSFSRMMSTNRMATQTNEFLTGLNLARSEAIRRGQLVSIRADVDGGDFAVGWTVFTDGIAGATGSGNGDPGSTATDGTVIRVGDPVAGRITITRMSRAAGPPVTYSTSSASDRRYVVFNSRGGNNGAAAFFRICDAGNSAIRGRLVQVTTVGRVSLLSTNETCT